MCAYLKQASNQGWLMAKIGKRNEITDLSINFQGYIPGSAGVWTKSLDTAWLADEGLNVNSEGWWVLWQRREHAQALAITFYESKTKGQKQPKNPAPPNKTAVRCSTPLPGCHGLLCGVHSAHAQPPVPEAVRRHELTAAPTPCSWDSGGSSGHEVHGPG